MADPRQMADEHARLSARLEAIALWNTHGRSVDEIAEVMYDRIITERRLTELNREIAAYIDGKGE